MTVSQFFIISSNGDVLLSRNLRNESNKNIDQFYKYLKERGDYGPIFELDGMLYFYIRRSSLYFVITTKHITSPSYVLELLQKITNYLKDFIGILNEESIKNNFILAYEILDEILDYGYIQCIDINQLKQKIYNTSTVSLNNSFKPILTSGNKKMMPSALSNKSLINPNNKNEIFVDILEKISVKMTSSETKYTAEGQIQIRSYLKGFPTISMYLNPDINLQLNNPGNLSATTNLDTERSSLYTERGGERMINNCTFDETVDYSRLEFEKVLNFVPKEGEYILMNYRIMGSLELPFKIFPNLNISENKGTLNVKVVCSLPFETSYFFLLTCKLPANTKIARMTTSPNVSNQACDYQPNDNSIYWSVRKMQGYGEVEMNSEMVFNNSNVNVKQFGPINLMFEIPLYSLSNLKISNLRVSYDNNYIKSYKWVRYLTLSHSYTYRF